MDKKKDWNLELSEYIKQGEPNRVEKTKTWETAIGLQDVDGLKPSKYLIQTAKEHIEGTIDIEEAKTRIDEYYEVQGSRKNFEKESEEADKVAVRITEILSEKAFNFSPTELVNIHKRLFKGIFDGAGIYRNYNFTKKEWVLNGETVIYASFDTIKETLEYDFEQEKNFSYKGLSLDESIKHLCRFTSNIWQVHPFCEGNTRTTAVFMIKYLRTFGFNINDEVFAENSWYFRNSLVRANYKNFEKNVFEDNSFLEKFFHNLLTNANYELKNRYTHIDNIQSANENNLKGNNCTLEEQAIINILKINPATTQEEISRQINKSVRTVKTYMAEMTTLKRKDVKMKKMFLLIALCVSTLSNAQDMAMATGEGLTPVTNTTTATAAETKPVIEYTFRTYGDIPVAKTAFEEEHYLGNDVSKKWNTFIANYRHEYSVSIGLSNSGYEFVKPAVYNAVQRANKYVKKALKKNIMTRSEAVSTLSHILDCANVICFEDDTKKFEDAAKAAKSGEDVIRLFKKVELVR